MKKDWEKHALRGKKNLDAIRHGSWMANQQRIKTARKNGNGGMQEAALIWKR